MTAGLPLIKRVHTLLAKNVLLSFALSAGMSAAGADIQKKKVINDMLHGKDTIFRLIAG